MKEEENWVITAIITLEEFFNKKQNSAIAMAKTTSLGFGRNDTSTTKASCSTRQNLTKALKGSDFITGKMKKIKAVMASNCDCDDVAMSSKSEKFAAKELATARETVRNYKDKKEIIQPEITVDLAFVLIIKVGREKNQAKLHYILEHRMSRLFMPGSAMRAAPSPIE